MIDISDMLLTQMVHDNINAWETILREKKISKDMLSYLNKHPFMAGTLELARMMITNFKLTDKQLKRILHPNFSTRHIEELVYYLGSYPIETVMDIANPNFNIRQVKEVVKMYENKFPKKLLNVSAVPEISASQMNYIIYFFKCGIKVNDLIKFASFSEEAMKLIYDCSFTPYFFNSDKISTLININPMPLEEMEIARLFIADGIDNLDVINTICSTHFSEDQINELRKSFSRGLPSEDFYVIANPAFDIEHMQLLTNFLLDGYPVENIMVIAKPSLFPEQMKTLKYGYDKGVTIEQIKSIALPEYSVEYMKDEIMKFCISNGVVKLREIINSSYS